MKRLFVACSAFAPVTIGSFSCTTGELGPAEKLATGFKAAVTELGKATPTASK